MPQCKLCLSDTVKKSWGLLSPFFARRVYESGPFPVPMRECRSCELLYFDVSLSESQLDPLYRNYRSDAYFEQRHSYEPWYTRKAHDALGGESDSGKRSDFLIGILEKNTIDNRFGTAIDHGGDRGQMLRGIQASHKYVYDISGVEPEPGIAAASESELKPGDFDLVLSCHVIEHLVNPRAYLEKLAPLAAEGGYFYIEVPAEKVFRVTLPLRINHAWIQFLSIRKTLVMLVDFISTAFRIKGKILLPFMVLTLKEHVNYFTLKSLRKCAGFMGLKIIDSGSTPAGHIYILARK